MTALHLGGDYQRITYKRVQTTSTLHRLRRATLLKLVPVNITVAFVKLLTNKIYQVKYDCFVKDGKWLEQNLYRNIFCIINL